MHSDPETDSNWEDKLLIVSFISGIKRVFITDRWDQTLDIVLSCSTQVSTTAKIFSVTMDSMGPMHFGRLRHPSSPILPSGVSLALRRIHTNHPLKFGILTSNNKTLFLTCFCQFCLPPAPSSAGRAGTATFRHQTMAGEQEGRGLAEEHRASFHQAQTLGRPTAHKFVIPVFILSEFRLWRICWPCCLKCTWLEISGAEQLEAALIDQYHEAMG